MAGSPILSLLALLLTAGGLLLNIFILLSGTFINIRPVNLIYFLSAGTSTWTYWSLCTLSGGQNTKCGTIHPAFPFEPSSQGLTNVPTAIISNHSFYYYLSRVSWSFFLIASFFAAVTLFSGIFACCTRIFGFLSGFNAFLAVAAQAVAAALMTAWTVKARAAYQSAGQSADLGRYGYGFTWAAFLCFFLAMILFCSSGGRKKKSTEQDQETGHHQDMEHQQHQQPDHTDREYQNTGASGYQTTGTEGYQNNIPNTYTTAPPVVYTATAPAVYQTTTEVPLQTQPVTTTTFFDHSASKSREATGAKDEYS